MTTPMTPSDIKGIAHESVAPIVLSYLHQNVASKLGKEHLALQMISNIIPANTGIKTVKLPVKAGYSIVIQLAIVKATDRHEIDIPRGLERDLINYYIFLLKSAQIYWQEFVGLNTTLINQLNVLTESNFTELHLSDDNSSLFFDPSFGYKLTNVSYYVDPSSKPLQTIEELQSIL